MKVLKRTPFFKKQINLFKKDLFIYSGILEMGIELLR